MYQNTLFQTATLSARNNVVSTKDTINTTYIDIQKRMPQNMSGFRASLEVCWRN
jgi:hypothetical protein